MVMRCWFIAIFVFLAIPPAAFAGKAETLPALKERAESAPLEMRPGLYTEIARREAEDADQLYTAGKAEEAEAAVEEAVKYSDKAREAAIRSSKPWMWHAPWKIFSRCWNSPRRPRI